MLIPSERLTRWVANFEVSHADTVLACEDGGLHGEAADGSTFLARLPFDTMYAGRADVADFLNSLRAPEAWGVLLVRKGGFAIAALSQQTVIDSKTGQRHVQGRTKAGGQSQQRFARRRNNQARAAYEAAADHAARIFNGLRTAKAPVVVGGDRVAVDEVLSDTRLAHLRVVPPWLAVPDPRRGILDQAILDAQSISISVVNAQSR